MDGQKCAHEQCTCFIDLGEFYCSDDCRRRDIADGDAEPHARCGCKHNDCMSAA